MPAHLPYVIMTGWHQWIYALWEAPADRYREIGPFPTRRAAQAALDLALDTQYPARLARPAPRGRGLWGRSLDDFIRTHAARIDQIIRARVRAGHSDIPGLPLLPPGHENDERARWVHHDEHLRQWARREGVKI
jgi:hypothetical protein